MTKQLYLQNTYLFESDSCIVECMNDEKGATYILLDQTIFYPQGGGQPCDLGKILNKDLEYTITNVRQIGDEIRHYIAEDVNIEDFTKHCDVKCIVDRDRRILNARYHTAGHLLGNVVEKLYPQLKALKCHAFPKEAYVEFQGSDVPNEELIHESLERIINEDLMTKTFEIDRDTFEATYYKLPYEIPENKKFRVIQIGDFSPIPCGGTHLTSTKEIGEITLDKMKLKNGVVKISFGIK